MPDNTVNVEFLENSKFEDAVSLYVFDKKLRLLLLDAIERVEISVRVDIAYLLGEKDKFAYLNTGLQYGNYTKKTVKSFGKTKHQL